ncbi:type II secretion system F family protein [Thermococcus paralvinellae]|uniref:Type II secretion system protein F domain-containing protein n=1 Tax=Thermococcus paralvinellae TaxID=582419 RepID=W0I900_9EURY|nr:type II secretion system F family protein [Thermococcus paralvinellae]AHF81232.1 type II secretion system protein F domain-containing protein [Thermococcus paralvinellae]
MDIKAKLIHILEKIGAKTIEVSEKPIRRVPKGRTLQEQIALLRQLKREIEKGEKEEEEIPLEEILEIRLEEIQSPLSRRLTDAVLKYFRGPVEILTKSLKGLDQDLYRANMRIFKERYVALMLILSFLAGIFSFVFATLIMMPISIAFMFGTLGFILTFVYMRHYPRIVWRNRVAEVEKALPYVLRHMAALLSAGVGIAEVLVSVARADYGVASEEFAIVVREMQTGSSFEEALTNFEKRMNSENVSRVIKQILRAIKFGGNLAEILYKMAEDFSFEYRMKLVDYVQKVAGVAFIYMFITIVMPTMLIVAILAASIMAKRLVLPISGLAALLLFGFPMLAFLMIVMIKRREPR